MTKKIARTAPGKGNSRAIAARREIPSRGGRGARVARLQTQDDGGQSRRCRIAATDVPAAANDKPLGLPEKALVGRCSLAKQIQRGR